MESSSTTLSKPKTEPGSASSIAEISEQLAQTHDLVKSATRETTTTNDEIANLGQAAGKIGAVVKLIQQVALTPSAHKELWNKWPEGLPSDATVETYLVRDRGFSEEGFQPRPHPEYRYKFTPQW